MGAVITSWVQFWRRAASRGTDALSATARAIVLQRNRTHCEGLEFTAKGWMDISRCGYGFFSVVRPGVPFLTPFLTGPYENVTITQVSLLSSCLLPIPRRSLLLNELHPSDFKECYSSVTVLFLSLWWSVGKCGFYQVSNYVQILWFSKEPPDNFTAYNGAVDAVATISGKHVLITGIVSSWNNWGCFVWGELVLGIFSPLSAGAVYLTDIGSSIWVCYVCFVVLKTSYMMLITKNMHCYALIFGVNSFLATVLQTILTAIVINTESSYFLEKKTLYIIFFCSYFKCIAIRISI
uniref:Solute carrier family 19 member 3 n=1 Tax=Paramormyrops kingsleyae TaxID=1676925 RepID=A0A3B3T3V0_9TELE